MILFMILSDKDLTEMLNKGIIKIDPLEEDQIGPASVDLTLDDEWFFFKKELMGKTVDLAKTPYQSAFQGTRRETIELKAGEMCLARTIEKITLPPKIMGKLEGRSRYARMGLVVHLTSALVQPGSDNHQVLEIANLSPFTVKLHAGMRISQVVFEYLQSPTTKPYAKFGKIAREQ